MKIPLFDIGDKIEVNVKGIVREISFSERGDCYVIELTDLPIHSLDRLYMSSDMLINHSKLIKRACEKDEKEG